MLAKANSSEDTGRSLTLRDGRTCKLRFIKLHEEAGHSMPRMRRRLSADRAHLKTRAAGRLTLPGVQPRPGDVRWRERNCLSPDRRAGKQGSRSGSQAVRTSFRLKTLFRRGHQERDGLSSPSQQPLASGHLIKSARRNGCEDWRIGAQAPARATFTRRRGCATRSSAVPRRPGWRSN